MLASSVEILTDGSKQNDRVGKELLLDIHVPDAVGLNRTCGNIGAAIVRIWVGKCEWEQKRERWGIWEVKGRSQV